MAIRIIDNKKIEITDDEYTLYTNICRSYDRPNFKGEELFNELFETDDGGIILFLRPPSKKYTSWEVFMFLIALMQSQHLNLMAKQVDAACKKVDDALAKLNNT